MLLYNVWIGGKKDEEGSLLLASAILAIPLLGGMLPVFWPRRARWVDERLGTF